MMLFWFICAVFIVIALAFVLPTALQKNEKSRRGMADERKQANIAVYRDQLSELEADLQNGIVSQEQYASDRDEIERRLLEDTATASAAPKQKSAPAAPVNRSTAYTLAISLPLIAVIFYLYIGNPKGITDQALAATAPPAASAPSGVPSQAEIEARVAALAKRLQTNPSDSEGWIMLARSYTSMERFGEAAGAYAKATELKPNDADLLADYAFVSALAAGRSLDGRPTEIINQALKVDPDNAKALQLAGRAAFQAKDYNKAIEYWERVLKKAPADSELAEIINGQINEAKTLAAGK